ncbi:MAG: radical SAM protein [Candidatus Promineifilaceae bacterium]|jgi:wyosine [tRNA(Phe)-imidazoG37] synthetase (radical SAM superfamily)
MKYVFGPVPSRRLGQSLGIDTIPLKTCNWNCVYCQLGRTVPLNNERREYFPRDAILEEIRETISNRAPGEIDWVTFVGSGEPTLHTGLGWLIGRVKEASSLPVAVITNGSLLYDQEVREDLSMADAVLPTLDAGTADLYRRINRPHPSASFERLVSGLIEFRRAFDGKLWIEVMLVRGMNDGEKALEEIAQILKRIDPDEIHINIPIRPPAETWVRPADSEGLMRAQSILGDVAKVVHPIEGSFEHGNKEDVLDAIIAIITRHPMRHEELEKTLVEWGVEEPSRIFMELESGDRAQCVERLGTRYWSAVSARYPDASVSKSTNPSRHRSQ